MLGHLLTIVLSLVTLAQGALYLVFAFKELPEPARPYFRIPGIFVFFPEQHRLRIGRIVTGLLLLSFSFMLACALLV